jgi:hypothetical protein
MNRITFNTGRKYTTLGQVITAEVREGCVLFKDHSRLICGEIEGVPPSSTPGPFATWVMGRYDRNEYRMSTDAIGLDQSDTIHNVRI